MEATARGQTMAQADFANKIVDNIIDISGQGLAAAEAIAVRPFSAR
jgi:hypothetical protein